MAKFDHIALDFLATLPQFQANVFFGTVTELRYGTVVRKHQSPEPKHRNTLELFWPGQPEGTLCLVEAYKYAVIAGKEAVALGDDAARIRDDLKFIRESS